MLKWFIGLSILLGSLSGALFIGSSVNAASVWDDEIVTSNTLELRSPDGNHIIDITNSYGTYLTEYCTSQQIDYMTNAVDNGGVLMVNRHLMNGTLQNSVYASYGIPGANTKIEFGEYVGGQFVYFNASGMTDRVFVEWHIDNNGEVTAFCNSSGNVYFTELHYSSGPTFGIPYIYLNTFPIEYPEDYDGEIIPETAGEIKTKSGGGFNPTSDFWVDDLDIEIIDTTEQALIESFEIDLCIFQLPDNTYGDTFTEYIYDCNNPIRIEHTFPEHGNYNVIQRMYSSKADLWYESTLVVKIDGNSYTGSIGDISAGLFENCLKSEFPFVDINACIENVKAVGSLLSFNSIAFGNYDFSNECRNLEVLGFWLNLENKTVCPQVPASIRNIITPFVTFIFGLLGLKFITNRGEGGFN